MNKTAPNSLPSFDCCRDAFDSAPGVCSLFDDDVEVVTVPDAIPLVSPRRRLAAATLRPPPPSMRPATNETVDLKSLMGRVATVDEGPDTFAFPPPVETITTILPTALTQPAPARLRYGARRASSFVLGALATVAAGLAMIHPIAAFHSQAASPAAAPGPSPTQIQETRAATTEAVFIGPTQSPVEAAAAQPLEKSAPPVVTSGRLARQSSPKSDAPSSSPADALPDPEPPPAPAPVLPPFDSRSALAAMQAAVGAASGCRTDDDPAAVARVSVTFASSGSVTIARVDGAPYAGTKTGSCVAKVFRTLRVDPFEGQPVTVHKSFLIR
ncbi:MAG: hypothetical protein HY898_30685 [Deltaproteobacteria bacterium]|nr:hypothetical protein [Deltaproteobacteria bacterium]